MPLGRRPRGTTSACAENTPIAFQVKPRRWNYLRVRGEYSSVLRSSPAVLELPPRARRIPEFNLAQVRATGNYLRVRGEYE